MSLPAIMHRYYEYVRPRRRRRKTRLFLYLKICA